MPSFSGEELDILSTLAYYQALGVPSLTAMELLRYWTPWGSNNANPDARVPSLYQLTQCIETLARKGALQTKNGYVALPQEPDFFSRRIEAKKRGIEKRRICLRFTRILPYVPYVRMVALTGSLAADNADEQSDIDILVGSEVGRIWTARILVTTLFQILGKRRHGAKIKNRICLNHYVALANTSDVGFHLSPEALTTAHIYAQALPMWGIDAFLGTQEKTPWLRLYTALPLALALPAAYCAPTPGALAFKGSLEKYLSPFWSFIEKTGGSFQKKHIVKKLAGKRVDPLEVLVNDNTLLFHYPFSRSKYALERYHQRMGSLAPLYKE